MEKMLNIVLFGPPGAGKGTQSERLIQRYGLVHMSTGDMLRSEISRGTLLGMKAKEIMDRGELVGDDIVISMIEGRVDDNKNAKGFIFDGFPRTTAQAIALDDLLQKKGTGISGMLSLEVDDEELMKRLLNRGKESGRSDDQDEAIIRRRIQEYNNKTMPLKAYYGEQGKLHAIKGVGGIDDIFNAIVERLTFMNAEMDLTALETDLEHLDLTVQDYEEAHDIEPELLLEIDAIKRSEAEEAQEARTESRKAKSAESKSPAGKAEEKPAKPAAAKTDKPATKSEKSPEKKPVAKAAVKPKAKKAVKKAAKKAATKPASKVKKKVVKKSATKPKKKLQKKVVKKAAKKTQVKKAAGKTSKKTVKAVKAKGKKKGAASAPKKGSKKAGAKKLKASKQKASKAKGSSRKKRK